MTGIYIFCSPENSPPFASEKTVSNGGQTPGREWCGVGILHVLQLRTDKVDKDDEMGETMGKRLWRRAPITPFCMNKPAKPAVRQLHPFSLDLCSRQDQLPGINYAAISRKGSAILPLESEPCQ